MNQLSWTYLADNGKQHFVGLAHGAESGHLVVHCNSKVVLIDFKVFENASYSIFIDEQLCEICIEKQNEEFFYSFEIDNQADTPRNRARKKLEKQHMLQSMAFLGALILVVSIALFGISRWTSYHDQKNMSAKLQGSGQQISARILVPTEESVDYASYFFVVNGKSFSTATTYSKKLTELLPNGMPLKEGDEFPYGQIATNVEAKNSWFTAKDKYEVDKLEMEVVDFNSKNQLYKKGISFMPITFGISFTNTPMNHARALVHIYQDGSVGVSTGAVEMGQSVNTKMLQVAKIAFGISANKVKLETTNTTRVANTSPSAASSTADLNGKAVDMACKALLERLTKVAAKMAEVEGAKIKFQDDHVFVDGKKSSITWEEIVAKAMLERVALSENAHYATPIIHFDKSKEKGHPFAYHVYGTAITGVTVDCVRGTYEIDYVKIVHDFGISMNMGIDLGQVEGALAQGIGWMTLEEIAYDTNGRLLSNALSTYKVPDVFSAPKIIETIPVETEGNKMAIHKSKAVGEPPLMYGIGAYFAIQQAVKAFNKNYELKFHAPFMPEKVLMGLYE